MADVDPKKITKLMEERATGYASRETAAKELSEMTGLSYDVAKAFRRHCRSPWIQKGRVA